MEKQEIKRAPDYKTLLTWAKKKSVILGDVIPTNKTKYNLLQLLWIYQNVRTIQLKDISPTDFITHQIKPQDESKIHNAKCKKLSHHCKWWLRRIIEEDIDARIYKRIVIANGCLFKWNANPVFVSKPSQVQLYLTFNYYFIYKKILTSYMEAATTIYNLLSI